MVHKTIRRERAKRRKWSLAFTQILPFLILFHLFRICISIWQHFPQPKEAPSAFLMVWFCWRGILLVMFYLKTSLFSFLNDVFSRYRIDCFHSVKRSFCCLLASMVPNRSAVLQIIVFLCLICTFPLGAVGVCSLVSAFNSVMCLGIGSLCLFCLVLV